jgi:Ca2+:H+ antiporter
LLALAIASVIIPTAFEQFTNLSDVPIARISRSTAIVLLLVYGSYLFFQLKTHSAMYAEKGKKVPIQNAIPKGDVVKGLALAGAIAAAQGRSHHVNNDGDDELFQKDAYKRQATADKDELQLQIWVAVFTLAASTAFVGLCTECMVQSISAITFRHSSILVEFMGLILLPIVGNAVEHATAVTVACKDKMDLAIGVAIGFSMQIALLVIPFSVILGWILGYDKMNLSFDRFQIAVLFVSVLLVNYLISDGKR